MSVHGSETLIPIADAQRLVLEACPPIPPRRTNLVDSIGCVCAEVMTAAEDSPPFDNSAVDGYAVRSEDTAGASTSSPVVLDVVGEIPAGARPEVAIGPGQAVKIMTGASIPPGADSVVMVENTSVVEAARVGSSGLGRVEVRVRSVSGGAIRVAGDDVRAGDEVFAPGTPITPIVAGVLATLNRRTPLIHPKPRVAVLSTGDELVDDGSALEPGQIRESNRTMLLGLVDRVEAISVDFGIVPDDESHLQNVLTRAATTCDAIVTSGGVSMGDYDVVKAVLGRMTDMTWMQIAIKPAKPFAFGLLADGSRRIPVFGLPGNPVSSMVSFELLVRPALRRMAGFESDRWHRHIVRAVADEPLRRSQDGKMHYQRVRIRFAEDGRVHVVPVRAQGSHQLAASALADGLAVIPDGGGIEAGNDVDVLLLLS